MNLRGEGDGIEQLVGGERGLLVAEVEHAVGHGASAGRGEEGDAGVVGEDGRGRVGRRAAVDDVSAYRPAVLVGDAAGPTGGLDKEGKVGRDGGVAADVGVGGSARPMVISVGVAVMKRSSLRLLIEMRCFCGRRAAARAKMSSVQPAMGVRVGFWASASNAAVSVGGAMRAYWVTLERISGQLIVVSDQLSVEKQRQERTPGAKAPPLFLLRFERAQG